MDSDRTTSSTPASSHQRDLLAGSPEHSLRFEDTTVPKDSIADCDTMDLDPKRVAVGILGLSMAMVGLMLSVVAPALGTFIPSMRPQMPPLAVRSPTKPKALLDIRSHRDSSASSASAGGSDVVSTSDVASSSSGSTIDVPAQQHVTFRDVNVSNALKRAVTAPASSTASSAAQSVQHTFCPFRARSSEREQAPRRASRPPPINLPRHSFSDIDALPTSSDTDDHHHQNHSNNEAVRSPKRAYSLLHLPYRKASSSKRNKALSSPNLPRTSSLSTSATPDSIMLPSPIPELPEKPLSPVRDSSPTVRRSKSTPSECFSKWRGKGKAKEEKEKDKSKGRHARASRATQPPTPVPRTHPYEAPYNFPSPGSPEAHDYVRKTRSGYLRRSATFGTSSPSVNSSPASSPNPSITRSLPRMSSERTASLPTDEFGVIPAMPVNSNLLRKRSRSSGSGLDPSHHTEASGASTDVPEAVPVKESRRPPFKRLGRSR